MTEAEIAKLATWLAKAGLEGRTETALSKAFAATPPPAGLPLARVIVFIDTFIRSTRGERFAGNGKSRKRR